MANNEPKIPKAYYYLNFPIVSTLLAFGPGGQSEINLIAILVGANLPYITLHHIVRLFIVMNIAPIIAKKFKDLTACSRIQAVFF